MRFPKVKWSAIGAGVAVLAGLVFWHAKGGKETVNEGEYETRSFEAIRSCAAMLSGDSAVARETFQHLVNGGVHVVSVDSLHRILGNDQPAEAVTHSVINGADTNVSIYLRAPRSDVLEHEIANAFVARHREAVLRGSDKAQTSTFYKAPPVGCVRYCPNCTGAY